MNNPKKISEYIIAENPYLKIMEKNFINQNGEKSSFLITAHNKKASIGTFVVPVTEDGEILYLEEYRYGPEKVVINFPVGMLEDGLSEEENCKKELLEETGYESSDFIFLGETIIENYFEGYIRYYIAKGCKRVASISCDGSEELTVHKVSLKEFEEMILDGKVLSSKTSYAFFLAKIKGFL